MSAATPSPPSRPGNGDHGWLSELISKVNDLTRELKGLTTRIRLDTDPAEDDVKKAHDQVTQLLTLIIEEILPRRTQFSRLTSGSIHNLNKELGALDQSGHKALIAIDVYMKTLSNEHRQQMNERRSNPRYSSDQESLQHRRYDAALKTQQLIAAAEGFAKFFSI